MRIRIDRNDEAIEYDEYEKDPIPKHSFKAFTVVSVAIVYGWVMVEIAKTCGIIGVVVVAVVTLFAAVIMAGISRI